MPYADREKQLEYQRGWNKRYYQKHRMKERRRIVKRKAEIASWFDELKRGMCCGVCGEKESICLDFHHRSDTFKDFDLAKVRCWGWGRGRILQEMKKCEVVCANCHRKIHAGIIVV